MNIYKGTRAPDRCRVTVDGEPLNPRWNLRDYSPTGFSWGYNGSGPAQLALAILAHHLQNDDRALIRHQDYKREVISKLPHDTWEITSAEIETFLDENISF